MELLSKVKVSVDLIRDNLQGVVQAFHDIAEKYELAIT